MTMVDKENRYARNIAVGAIGRNGQRLLKNGSVMVVGCGALGSLAGMYLAGAGVGRIGIADFDTIDISNLQRQLFFSEAVAGKRKSDELRKRMSGLNSEVDIRVYGQMITRKSALEIFPGYDFIIDATDNPASKFLVDETCENLGLPCCVGGVSEFSGQICTMLPGSPRYRHLFPEAPDEGLLPCSAAGVAGPAAGVVASVQAAEAIKYLTGNLTGLLCGKMLLVDLLGPSFRILSL